MIYMKSNPSNESESEETLSETYHEKFTRVLCNIISSFISATPLQIQYQALHAKCDCKKVNKHKFISSTIFTENSIKCCINPFCSIAKINSTSSIEDEIQTVNFVRVQTVNKNDYCSSNPIQWFCEIKFLHGGGFEKKVRPRRLTLASIPTIQV